MANTADYIIIRRNRITIIAPRVAELSLIAESTFPLLRNIKTANGLRVLRYSPSYFVLLLNLTPYYSAISLSNEAILQPNSIEAARRMASERNSGFRMIFKATPRFQIIFKTTVHQIGCSSNAVQIAVTRRNGSIIQNLFSINFRKNLKPPQIRRNQT